MRAIMLLAGGVAFILRFMPGLDYSSIYIDRVGESNNRLPRHGFISSMTVLASDNFTSTVIADGVEMTLQSKLPPGSVWQGVQVRERQVVRKEFVSGKEEVCLEHLAMDVRSGVVTNGNAYVINPAGEMTGWATIRRCKQ